MNTIEDFKNAPAGATATGPIGRAMKMVEVDRYWMADRYWMSQDGVYFSDVTMEFWGFTLDLPTPTTARVALSLLWKLAYPVKEGQVIPKGTQYLEYYSSGVEEHTAQIDIKIIPALVPMVRTFDPLPGPEPDWLDAPVVIAAGCGCPQGIWLPEADGDWTCARCQANRHWSELADVTPFYPKGQEEDAE